MDLFSRICSLALEPKSQSQQSQQQQGPQHPQKVTGTPEVIVQYVYNDILAVKTQIKKYNELTGILTTNNLYYKLFKLVENDHYNDVEELKKKFEYDVTSNQYNRQLLQLYKSHLNDYSNLLDIFRNNYNHGIYESNIVKYRSSVSSSSNRSRSSSMRSNRNNNNNTNNNNNLTSDQASSIFSMPSIDSAASSVSNFSVANSPKSVSRKQSLRKVIEGDIDYSRISDEAPDSLLDPISFDLFSDPVITPSGITGHIAPESRTYPDLQLVDSVFDTVSDSITFVLSSSDSGIIEVQQFMKNGDINVLASFPLNDFEAKLLNFIHVVESSQLIFVLSNGDIITATYDSNNPDESTTIVEIVGSIDSGINSASWSPDEETLALLTGENKLLLLSRIFEPISERELDSNDIKISDSKHVSVGWGKKETQFKGKGFKALEREREALKHAGLDVKEDTTTLRDPTVGEIERGEISQFDNYNVTISWRGDCEYFSITTIEPVLVEDTAEMYDRRVIRVFTREGELDSVNEAVDGLEHNLAWKPQGSLIASTQRHLDDEGDEVLELVFYERNGLRHGQFNTRLDPLLEVINNLQWSSDSEVLLFQLYDRVQLWTCKNYHWYLKQELFINLSKPENQILFAKFHPEKPLHLMIGTSDDGIEIIDLGHKIVTGPTQLGDDVGMSLVTDGSIAKITPLSIANVPPPISFRELDINENITDLVVSKSNEKYAILSSTGNVYLSYLSLESMRRGGNPKVDGKIDSSLVLTEPNEVAKQIAFIKDWFVVVIVDGISYSKMMLFDVEDVENPKFNESIPFNPKIVLAKPTSDFNEVAIECIDGRVMTISPSLDLSDVCLFPQLCREFEVANTPDEDELDTPSGWTAFGISSNGKLFANEKQIASAVTSIKVTESHLLFTTAQAQLCFVHLKSGDGDEEYGVFQTDGNEAVDERIRQIERGSWLVSAMPSKYSVVLEAPRGNLETICPRIMVLSGVRKFIKQLKYKEAFLACRTHRIDLDLLHDYDPELFFSNIEIFINQIKKVEHLDLFVSCLHEEDTTKTKYRDTIHEIEDGNELSVAKLQITSPTPPPQDTKRIIKNKEEVFNTKDSKVNKICEAILSVLLRKEYFEPYLQTIITAYACEKPPNLVDALKLIGDFKNPDQVESTVTHLCFLQDVNKLYNTALGLYDVKLTLAIGQKSQKDPKEYLPFLQNLHVQTDLRKKFLIDDYLKNYEKALHWLFEIGSESHQEFDDYVVQHELYKKALSIYKYDDTRSNAILHLYAEHLNAQQEYVEAAISYEFLGQYENAIENYILSKRWNESLSLVQKVEFAEQANETAERLISSLTEDHKYADAAEISFYFLGNIEQAVILYCKNYYYDRAILLATKEKHHELLESAVDIQLNEGFGTIAELLADCKSQILSQLKRLRELRAKKAEDPYAFYGAPDDLDTPDNVSVAASETSTTPSFFTRYTGKTSGTAKTGASRRTAKNRKREERKRAKGRKGTIYEEEYLIRSVGRLIERLDQTQADAIRLIEGLIRRHMKEKAYLIQNNWIELTDLIKQHIVEIHDMSERDRERIDDNGEVYLIPEIPVPVITEFPKKHILDF
ncbi:RNA polymerase II Elongator subunit [Scheffersomyces amazonensis]|uniref:RNA polymerase II Elongator subunit n=1 Tax=Scheffersomyces amazonensis TaxID=1078765 RepID=UPI00315DD3BB